MRRLADTVHLPGRRTSVQVLTAALAASAIAWYAGVNAWHAIGLGCAVTVIGLALRSVSAASQAGRDLNWRYEERPSRSGSRDEILNLSWSLRAGWGLVGRTAEVKLRQVARRRLALEGLDLDDPAHRAAIEARIGAPAHATLTRQDVRGLRLTTVTALMDDLDAIDPQFYPPVQPPVRRWVLHRNPFR